MKKSHNLIVFLMDLATSLVASLVAILTLRTLTGEIPGFKNIFLAWMIATTASAAIGFVIAGSYKIVVRHSTIKSIGKHFTATLVKELVMLGAILLGFFKLFGYGQAAFLATSLIYDGSFTLIFLILLRVAIITGYDSQRQNYADEVTKIGAVVYGTSNKSIAMVTRLLNSPNYNVIGFITPDKHKDKLIIHDTKVWAYEDDLDFLDLRNRLGFECLIIADHTPEQQGEIDNICMCCLHNGIHVLNTPRIAEAHFGGMSQEAIKEVGSQEMIVDGMSAFQRNLKRTVDCVLAGLLLIVFSPLFLICYLAIKLSDKGPAIYKQERIGRFGRPFNIYKFRSMRTDAEAAGPALYAGDDDPRLTKVGKFLRQHHLDELPQLWNVFIGDMAFIGWRPERKFYIDQIMEHDPRYYFLYQIRPGVTSYSTLKNGYTDTMEKMLRRLEFDLYYLRHRSMWFDIKILFATFMNIVFGKKF